MMNTNNRISRGRFLLMFFAGFAFLSSTANGLAEDPASKPSIIDAANSQMLEGNYAKAVELLSAGGSAYMNDPEFYIALGRAYLGASNYTTATTALTTAIGKKSDSKEAYLRLACARALQKNYKGAFESMDQATRLDSADERIPYARCIINLLAGQYDKSLPDIEVLGKLDGPFAKSVAGRLPDLAKFTKDQADLAAKRQKALEELKAAMDKSNSEFQDAKKQWDAANSDKTRLTSERDNEKKQAQKDYQSAIREIAKNYDTKLPAAGLNKTNPAQYNTQKSQADQYKTNAEKDAVQKRDQTLITIENKYKPQLDAVEKKLKELNDRGVKLQAQYAKDKQKYTVQDAQDKQHQPSWPFDIIMALRTLPPPGVADKQPAANK